MILENTIKQASQLLKNHNIISHELDAEIILSDIMGVSKEFLMVNNQIDISKVAKTLRYTTFSVRTKKSLENTLEKIRNMKGPIMILVKIQQNKEKKSERVGISPIKIKERFMQNI